MSKPSMSMKVLYGEQNEQVLASQAEALQNAGFSVQTAVGRKAIQEALNKGGFDLVILGPTLSRDDRHHLPYMAEVEQDCARAGHAYRWLPPSLRRRQYRHRGGHGAPGKKDCGPAAAQDHGG